MTLYDRDDVYQKLKLKLKLVVKADQLTGMDDEKWTEGGVEGECK